ncbi:MAG: toll/interleukin-1 receptor domain-containing protein [Candidatus Thiosymbion ectosymbiont of Robbea hypermnestra]|nr:toll/interleukin-1 receptor domain-containing protein [Candidatus Thiosymbion ectosymbiont of Robbea hypermnestra]
MRYWTPPNPHRYHGYCKRATAMDDYRHHAFISYAWADNQPFDAPGRADQGRDGQARRNGWISVFHDRLCKHLGRTLGRIPEGERVWLDYEQLRGNDAVTPRIIDELNHSASLIPILSKAWFDSPWCRQEFTTFIAQAPDPLERLFPVWMEPVENTELDEDGQKIRDRLQKLHGYQFWYKNDAGRIRTRWFPSMEIADRDYSDTQQDMARDIADMTKRLGLLERPAKDASVPESDGAARQAPPTPRDPPAPPTEDHNLVIVIGGSGDASLIGDITRTLNARGDSSYRAPLMVRDQRGQYKPSELRRDLRENLEQANTVLMVVDQGPRNQINEQLYEYAQAAARHPERKPNLNLYHLGKQPLDLRPSGLDPRIHPIPDGDMSKILELAPQPPAKPQVQRIIEGIIPSVSTQPDSTTTLRQMRDERTRQLSGHFS